MSSTDCTRSVAAEPLAPEDTSYPISRVIAVLAPIEADCAPSRFPSLSSRNPRSDGFGAQPRFDQLIFGVRRPRDQLGAAAIREVVPEPLHQHDVTIPKPNQEADVDAQPEQPGHEPRELEPTELSHGRAPTDCR